MPKTKRGSKENPLKASELVDALNNAFAKPTRSFKIIAATIKDDFCNYNYENTEGVGIGDKVKVERKKAGYIKDDMKTAFAKLNAHLAFIDDVFTHASNEVKDIDMMHSSDLTFLYEVNGIKIQGGDENESVILLGDKYVNIGGRISLETPKIPIDQSSSYKWYNELKTAIDLCREEVALYAEGKYHPVEVPDDLEDPAQIKISFGKGDENDSPDESTDPGILEITEKPSPKDLMVDFDGARV